jgi:hypothetical protein
MQDKPTPSIPWDDLDPGIRGVVAWLASLGFEPTDSGDGAAKFAEDFVDASTLDFPHVFMVVRATSSLLDEADRLYNEVQDQIGESDGTWTVEASYSPKDGQAVLSLFGVDDARLSVVATREGT